MNRKVGNRFEIPPAALGTLTANSELLAITFYEKILVRVLRRATGTERGLKILQRIGIGMIFAVLAMAVAALVEKKRLTMADKELERGEKGQSLQMSVFWLAPQCIILGIADSFSIVGLQEYFYEQAPDSMRSLGLAFLLSAMGVRNFIGSFLVTITVHITEKFGTSWLGKDVNSSRLDKFYWPMVAISILNLCIYALFARRHSYKSAKSNFIAADILEVDNRTQ